MNQANEQTRVGIVGTGFIAMGAYPVIRKTPGSRVTCFLTRRDPQSLVGQISDARVTNEIDELIEHSDIVFECSGDVIWSTLVIERALAAGKKVVTMNSEFHVTTGSYFVGKGYLTEACGDQPGALAALHRDAVGMGFEPVALVNIKGFLNPTPTEKDMKYWSERQGLSLHETISFTDGTKLQIEQAFVANGLGADIAREGMVGGRVDDLTETDYLVEESEKLGGPLSDYVLAAKAPPGVFLLAKHDVQSELPHYGPYEKLLTKDRKAYLLLRTYHLCALEVANTLREVAAGVPILLDNSHEPRISISALAKKNIAAGEPISRAIGGFDVRGVAVRTKEEPDHVPIGLLDGARTKRALEPGQRITFDDVEIRPTRAAEIWQELRGRITRTA